MKPIKVNDFDLSFGGDVNKLIPKYEDIPDEFKNMNSKWNRVVSDWFFNGLNNSKWKPKEGVDTDMALRHVATVMASWDIKHEHKEASCAYLLSEFFKDVSYN